MFDTFSSRFRISRLVMPAIIALALSRFITPAPAGAESPVDAFYLKEAPFDYVKAEKLFGVLKEGGANTIIVKLENEKGGMDLDMLTNVTFLAHHAGLKLFVILATRANDEALLEHPEWEDLRYDLGSGTVQGTNRLDLSLPPVKELLVKKFKEIAAYSVDGILLGDDFSYSDTEGMGAAMLEAYQRKFGAALAAGSAFVKVGGDSGSPKTEVYGQSFWNWAGLKKNVLLELYQSITRACREVNSSVQFGISVPAMGFVTSNDALAHYSYDMNEFRKLNVDYYWIAVPHREIRAQQNLNYKKGMESLMRIVQSTMSMVKDPVKTIVAVQTTSLTGKILPFSEIEEVTALVRQSGNPGLAFMIDPETPLPGALSKKLFKRSKNK